MIRHIKNQIWNISLIIFSIGCIIFWREEIKHYLKLIAQSPTAGIILFVVICLIVRKKYFQKKLT